MLERLAATALMGLAMVSAMSADQKPPAGKSVMHEITVTADDVYQGTIDIAIDGGKVSGSMKITSPTEITGVVAGTSKAGELTLEFPYHMTDNNCDGTVKMAIKLPEKPGPSTGTMEAYGCGRDVTDKLTGTVELKPIAAKQ